MSMSPSGARSFRSRPRATNDTSGLRSCRAFEAYQKLYVGRVEADRVVEFLLLHPGFPRSVRFSLEAAARALEGVSKPGPGPEESPAQRLLGRVLSDLRYAEVDQVLRGDLRAFLAPVLDRCNQASRALQQQYWLH